MRAAAVLEGGSTPAAPIRVHVPGVLNVVAQGTIVAPAAAGPPALLETIDVNNGVHGTVTVKGAGKGR